LIHLQQRPVEEVVQQGTRVIEPNAKFLRVLSELGLTQTAASHDVQYARQRVNGDLRSCEIIEKNLSFTWLRRSSSSLRVSISFWCLTRSLLISFRRCPLR